MISLKLTELEGGYFVPELNGHPVDTERQRERRGEKEKKLESI